MIELLKLIAVMKLRIQYLLVDSEIWIADVYDKIRWRLMTKEQRRRETRQMFSNPPDWLPADIRAELLALTDLIAKE